MGDFTKVSNYNPQANFNMVRFGADTPITEYELNEVQQIQQNVLKTALVNTIGNGFIKSGNLIDSGTSITLSNSVVHLNGKVFEIDSLTSTLNEGETIYLDVFTKTISKTDSIKNLGNQQTSTTVTNYLQDTRLLGIETARREQVCYNLVKTTGVANHDYLIVCKRENGEFKDLRPLGNLNTSLHTTENTSYITKNGVKEFECKNGYVDNIAIEGETLVNLALQNTTNRTNDRNRVECSNVTGITEFTIINYSSLKIRVDIFKYNEYLRFTEYSAGTNTFVQLEEGESLGAYSFIYTEESNEDTLREFKTGFVILEGDHTDKPISYFEGLKSIGQGDKIEVLTREPNKTNLLKSQNVTYKDNYMIVYEHGLESASNNHKYTETYIEVEPNTDYCFYHISRNICWYDENKNFIFQPLNKRILGENVNKDLFFSAKSPSNAKYLRVTIIKDIHNNGKTSEIYKGKYDYKQISTTLRSLPNGVKDTIEKRGNKYVKVQRCGEFTIPDFDTYIPSGVQHQNLYTLCLNKDVVRAKGSSMIYSDRFSNISDNDITVLGKQGIWIAYDGAIVISVLISNLETQDRNGYIKYLSGATIVYELETPIITELPNFNPQTFEGNTTLLLNSGVVQADASFEVTNSLGNELEVLKQKVSDLDDNTFSVTNSQGGTFAGELDFGGTDSPISTAQFLSILADLGAFSTPYWCSRGTWSYANNVTINDTGVGNVHLAGAFIEVIGTTSTLCTIKVTSANSGNSAYGDFVYINNGPGYNPGWRKIYNTHTRPYTISSAYPSGGANGDVWFRYE